MRLSHAVACRGRELNLPRAAPPRSPPARASRMLLRPAATPFVSPPWPPLAPQRRTAARARADPQQPPNPLALGPLKLLTPTPSIPLARARRSAARTAAELLLTLRPHLRPFPTPTEHTPG